MIAVQGQTRAELINRMDIVFKKLQDCGLHLNKKKCKFFEKSIDYLGHRIDERGLHPMKEKIIDIVNSKRPTDVSSLRTFLGMVNYYQQFIPNLALKLNPLYKLLQKNNKFTWTKECESIFIKLKEELCSDKVLVPFHNDWPVTLATDASPTGFGAVLSHILPNKEERPIAYASRSLTKAEKNYSQLDKEAAALIWGLKKFFQYCYGRKIILIIDNQPLSRILHPDKATPITTAIRLIHYANFLAGFNYELKLRKTTEHSNADYLSRILNTNKIDNEDKLTDDDKFYINQIKMLPITFQTIKEATARDPELQKMYHEIQSGKDFGKLHEFSLQNGCIFYGIRVTIPKQLQGQILQELHTAHTGIVKMKALARSYVWWRNIDGDIENMARGCKACCLVQNNSPKVPVHKWEYPKEPWNRLHIDYAGPFIDHYFLIVVDAYTKWLEVIPTKTMTASSTVKILKKLFTTFGLPVTIVSDNGRQFRSEEIQQFYRENGITARYTAPFHPATNGQAERYVQTFKNKLKAMAHENGSVEDKLQKFLTAYRKTQNSATGLSPAEMMFKRLYRTRIDLVKRNIYTEINNKMGDNKYYKEYKIGERVQVRSYDDTKWRFGEIINKKGRLHYEVVVDGKVWTRHVDQIRETLYIPSQKDNYKSSYPFRSTASSNEEENSTLPNTSNEETQEVPTEASTTPRELNTDAMPEEFNMPETTTRRSTRIRKAPERLNL
ncbi:hypothetical protein O3G_MSEX002317 [Manduca sexta]|uniref:RNA-directed DNA polymerase n=1 Tax=Manduca sexta TaxID=7130 RepID=A0A921YNL1_MANSE|nr:hypothetical protein O3G_MSEX002317 [Manduca sexta]KAG6442305.1 hypothetical protein O3G_MSEX002317 [Manduca sexta]KAG6442306.1 hypothetical protein O3G_MSEX002317 [Manduca sexta]